MATSEQRVDGTPVVCVGQWTARHRSASHGGNEPLRCIGFRTVSAGNHVPVVRGEGRVQRRSGVSVLYWGESKAIVTHCDPL